MTVTIISRAAATNIRWRGEQVGDNGDSQPAEGLLTGSWQGSAKVTRLGGSNNGLSSCC